MSISSIIKKILFALMVVYYSYCLIIELSFEMTFEIFIWLVSYASIISISVVYIIYELMNKKLLAGLFNVSAVMSAMLAIHVSQESSIFYNYTLEVMLFLYDTVMYLAIAIVLFRNETRTIQSLLTFIGEFLTFLNGFPSIFLYFNLYLIAEIMYRTLWFSVFAGIELAQINAKKPKALELV